MKPGYADCFDQTFYVIVGCAVVVVVIIIVVLVIALVQQQRFHKDKKRFRDADRYENNLRELPYMGAITPRAPTETTSLCGPRIDEILVDEPVFGRIFDANF